MICPQVFALLCACALIVHSEADSDVGEAYIPSGTPDNSYEVTTQNPPEPPTLARGRRSSSGCTPTELTEEQQNKIVDFHNARRSEEENSEGLSGIVKLTWDDDLAGPAQDWANECKWYHGNTWACSGTGAGQNMALRTGPVNLEADMSAWFNEKNDYDYGQNSCSGVCGHYTQMVWDRTSKIGCGIKVCSSIEVQPGTWWSNAVIHVCNYNPPGNWLGQKPYSKGNRCSGCSNLRMSELDPFICTSDNLCSSTTVINDTTCEFSCVNGIRSSDNCFCECDDGYCGIGCQNDYSCVFGTTSGQYGCGCECNEGYCGTSCDKQWVEVKATQNLQSDSSCNYWKNSGYCTGVYQSYMELNCAAACEVSTLQCP